jgi:hydrophobe/amphiphile efflux-1 (HAE1) family protein
VTLSEVSIERPVLTWMMILALIVFGVLGYNRLGVDQFPNMEFPVLSVTAVLQGASPEGMEEDVTDVLEEQLNTIAGVRTITSTSSEGSAQIAVEFQLGTDIDVVIQEVRDKVALARRDLPLDLEPVIVGNFNPNDQPVLWIPIESERSMVETSEFVKRQMNPYLETIPGVAGVAMFGRRDRNIRIWLDGDEMRARGLGASDVLEAIRREHVEAPGGEVQSTRVEYSVRTDAEFRTVADLETLVVSHADGSAGGAPVLLRDVARITDGAEDLEMEMHYNATDAVGVGIRRQSGGNTVAIVDEVLSRLDQIEAILPSGIHIYDPAGFIDFSKGVREAVEETEFALLFGALLAVLTVFVFLRRTRPTLIVAASIPISLIATFGLVWLFGFTLNTMTLLGMTLAVGVVIDDAIVVLENIERHRERGADPMTAARTGTSEIAFAATAATISVAAVFIPAFFVEGLVGNFLGEFGLTVAGSVLISLFVALTLTPMLAARMPAPKERAHGSVYHRLEQGFTALERSYAKALFWTLGHRIKTVVASLASIGLIWLFGSQLDTEFFPPSDEGIFFVKIEAAPGTSLAATTEYLTDIEKWFLAQPEVAGAFGAAGTEGGHARTSATHKGMVFATLVSSTERERSVFEIMSVARRELGRVPGRVVRIFNPGEMMSMGGGGFEFQIRGHLPLEELDDLAQKMLDALEREGGFVSLDKSLKLGMPELRVKPDREKAAALGISARDIAQTVQVMIGGMDVGVFKEAGRRYDIRVRLEEEYRRDPAAIGQLYVRSREGEAIELRNVVDVVTTAAPSEITRTARQRSVSITGSLEERTLGEAIQIAQRIAAEILPEGASLGLAGQAEAMREGAEQFMLAVALAILVIYMVLAAQFESLVHPLTVMLALPLAMVGALGGLLVTGNTLNLFSMIGVILLFGLVTKNSILLVDYANQLRKEGLDKVEAMKRAAPVRMRPVLMTAISMIFGVMPAALGIGPGAESRAPMAIATAAGMFSSTMLTLLVVPLFYVVIDDAADFVKRGFRRLFGGVAALPSESA